MANNLPNELIREILSPVLHVPDKMFRETSLISPFCRPSHLSSASVLGVCKRWMVIAIPLLYHVVILRSKAQACSLERTLRKYKELGAHIRKLRVEGGYGAPMRTIIISAPNITHLCLSLDIRSSDSVKGLCSSLSFTNPYCLVVLALREERSNMPLKELVKNLSVCFVKWTNLVEVYFSLLYMVQSSAGNQLISDLIKIPNLRTITSPFFFHRRAFLKLVESPSLNAIRLVTSHAVTDKRRANFIESLSAKVNELIVFDVTPVLPVIDVALPSNEVFVPLAHVSNEVHDAVWGHVLRFALEVDIYRDGYIDERFVKQALEQLFRTRASVPQVSRAFKRLSDPYVYGYPIFRSSEEIGAYANAVAESPDLRGNLRSFQFRDPAVDTLSAFKRWGRTRVTLTLKHVYGIFSQSAQLTRICALKTTDEDTGFTLVSQRSLVIPWDSFEALANTVGPVLKFLDNVFIKAAGTEGPPCPSIFGRFSVLRSFACCISTRFNVVQDRISSHHLSTVQYLQLGSCHSSFLQFLSCLDLDALHNFQILETNMISELTLITFFKVHGPKIRTLRIGFADFSVFDLCPNMITLRMYKPGILSRDEFRCETPHTNISKLIIESLGYGRGVSNDQQSNADASFFSSLDLSRFPNLRDIQIHSLSWPRTEHEISKSCWPQCAEILAKQNVTLTDKKGCYWRPRLRR